jgi:hypothetical protein
MRTPPLTLRVFISSPGDVDEERRAAREVMEALEAGHLLRDRVRFVIRAWDDVRAATPMDARVPPQESVNRFLGRPADCDLTLVILWSRLGTPLAASNVRPDGTRYESGTIYEYEDAIAAGKPVFVYRRRTPVTIEVDDPEFVSKRTAYENVKGFFARFTNPDGSLKAGVTGYGDVDEFRRTLRHHLEAFVKDRLDAAASPLASDNSGAGHVSPGAPETSTSAAAQDRPLHPPDTRRPWSPARLALAACAALAGVYLLSLYRSGGKPPDGETHLRPAFAVAGSLSAIGVERTTVSQRYDLAHDHRNCTDDRPAWNSSDLCLDDRSAKVQRATLAAKPVNAQADRLGRPECFRARDIHDFRPFQAKPYCATVVAELYECNLTSCLVPGGNRTSYTVELEGQVTRETQLEAQTFTYASTRERSLEIQYTNEIPRNVSPTEWKWSVRVREVGRDLETLLTHSHTSQNKLVSQFNVATRTLLLVFP